MIKKNISNMLFLIKFALSLYHDNQNRISINF
nr:MAG TPA: hypothetical protein [Caudoviricetes sp.]